MKDISRRDYFAATADVTWTKDATLERAAAKSGVNAPGANPTEQQLANFWIKVEIAWRWKYADLMLRGRD